MATHSPGSSRADAPPAPQPYELCHSGSLSIVLSVPEPAFPLSYLSSAGGGSVAHPRSLFAACVTCAVEDGCTALARARGCSCVVATIDGIFRAPRADFESP